IILRIPLIALPSRIIVRESKHQTSDSGGDVRTGRFSASWLVPGIRERGRPAVKARRRKAPRRTAHECIGGDMTSQKAKSLAAHRVIGSRRLLASASSVIALAVAWPALSADGPTN